MAQFSVGPSPIIPSEQPIECVHLDEAQGVNGFLQRICIYLKPPNSPLILIQQLDEVEISLENPWRGGCQISSLGHHFKKQRLIIR